MRHEGRWGGRPLDGPGFVLLAGLLVPVGIGGQVPHDPATHDHADAPAAHSPSAIAAPSLSPIAEAQVGVVEAAVRDLARPEVAVASGFAPALGLIPTMGTHWVNRERMLERTVRGGVDLARPEHLMFAPVNGVQTLVGVAFAYQARPGQPTPDAFDGELDQWHTHPELSPAGRELTMLHVWLVPSPDGPFAGHNPWLPFMAVGLDLPDASRLADTADSYRLRALALALAETVEPFGAGRLLEALPRRFVAAGLDGRRDAIRAEIPRLKEATQRGDLTAWNAAADRAVAQFEAIRSTYLAAIPLPAIRTRLADFYGQMLSGSHGSHAQ